MERKARAGTGASCTQSPSPAVPGVLHGFALAQALWQATHCQKSQTNCISLCLSLPAPHWARGGGRTGLSCSAGAALVSPPSPRSPGNGPAMLQDSLRRSPEFPQRLPWCKAIYHRVEAARSLKATPWQNANRCIYIQSVPLIWPSGGVCWICPFVPGHHLFNQALVTDHRLISVPVANRFSF